MFKVVSKKNGYEYIVFAVNKYKDKTEFLTWCCEGWQWVDSNLCTCSNSNY